MLRVEYAPGIEDDLVEAASRYAAHQPKLGFRFLADFRQTTDRIAAHGHVYREVIGNYRRLHLANFPYAVYFVVRHQRAIVYLVIDATRDPTLIARMLRTRR